MTEPVDLGALRQQVDAALERVLPPTAEPPSRLHEAMRYAVFAGGKRLRPACCLLAAQAVGGEAEAALPGACGLELIHTYSLVHDDLPSMDDDDLRRGRPTVHRAYDEATAVLVGDGLQTLAFSAILEGLPPEVAAPAGAALAKAAGSLGMVGGQAEDLAAEGKTLDRAGVLFIDQRKTAALFSAAFEIGGWCGGASAEVAKCLRSIGADIGVAFQIIDDLLDRTASAEEMGKATGKDEARGKATLPSLLGSEAAFREAEALSASARAAALGLPRGEPIAALIDQMLQRGA